MRARGKANVSPRAAARLRSPLSLARHPQHEAPGRNGPRQGEGGWGGEVCGEDAARHGRNSSARSLPQDWGYLRRLDFPPSPIMLATGG